MWGRSPRYDSDFRAGKPGSSQRRAWPRPSEAEAGGPRRGSVPSGGSQVAWGRSPANHEEEGRRRSPDRRPAPPPCPPGSDPTPSRMEALDFHGKAPPLYPHWCSLCDVTVMSEKVWLQHINGTPHADGQLQLLQRFPHWDCRLEPDSRAAPLGSGSGPAPSRKADSQSERRREEGAPEQPPETTLPAKTKKKAVSRSSVVCVKFPPQAVDEVFLRRLAERFGPVIQVLMFPSLAFMELGSAQQAQDLVRFHQEEPPTVQGQQMEFRVSHTFSFPQSSRVVSFSPAPPAGGELMARVRGFGSPLYMLVLPSAVLVEMEEATDAQKLLDHFSSNSLKINGEAVTVTLSREFRSLMRVNGALKCQEEGGGGGGGGGGGSSSREQGSSNRTWSPGSPGSQAVPAAPPAGEAEPEEDSESSAESDIEGMEVIAANLEDDDLENLEEEEEEEQEAEVPQEVDSPADLENCCTTLDQLEEDAATAELHEATSAPRHQPCLGRGAAADTSSSREKRPHGPEESKRSLEEQQQRRSSSEEQRTTQRSSVEESAPPPDWSHDSPWTRSRGGAAVEEQGAAGPEETLRRRASSQNHQEPEEKKRRRSGSTAEQELNHQQGATSTPELLQDSESQQAEPAGGATGHQNPAQPVGTEFVRPVVGYFCHLCQVIFADEDEAKGQHCSSPAHYRKYQEKTGRDPWR